MWIWLVVDAGLLLASRLQAGRLRAGRRPPAAVLVADGFARFVSARGGQQRWRSPWRRSPSCCARRARRRRPPRAQQHPTPHRASPPLPISANDEVVVLRTSPFGLPFYLRHRQPIRVVEEFGTSPGCARRTAGAASGTRWQLRTGARPDRADDPASLARSSPARGAPCGHSPPATKAPRQPDLARLQPVATHGNYASWRRPATIPHRAIARAASLSRVGWVRPKAVTRHLQV